MIQQVMRARARAHAAGCVCLAFAEGVIACGDSIDGGGVVQLLCQCASWVDVKEWGHVVTVGMRGRRAFVMSVLDAELEEGEKGAGGGLVRALLGGMAEGGEGGEACERALVALCWSSCDYDRGGDVRRCLAAGVGSFVQVINPSNHKLFCS
jgi:hypothetical protein